MYKTIKTNLCDSILTLTLNQPDSLNAYSHQMSSELLDFFERVNANDDVRVIVVTGAGKSFCAGMDLSAGASVFGTDQSEEDFRDIGGKVSMKIFKLNKPIIAAINGAAVGIGMTMTLPMDIRIAKKGVKMGFVFGCIGIGPDAASGWFLPKVVGVGKALEWTLTGRYVPTHEALMTGLIQYEEEYPLTKAYEIAQLIINNTAATSNHFTRKLLWNMTGSENPLESHVVESKFLHWASEQNDVVEGVQSFLEKRKVNFPMKASDVLDFFDE